LLGDPVRYDGAHKRDAFLADVLGPFVEWVPVCPEVEVGLGVPRDPIRLAGHADAPRLVVETTGEDITTRMRRYAVSRARALAALGLDGYVLKSRSPSCGVLGVPVHDARGVQTNAGRGIFAAALMRRLPMLAVEDDERLADPHVRAHFLERVFAAWRWRTSLASDPVRRDRA
jgi:uncharacterized protein YbbK (DUF523 family)